MSNSNRWSGLIAASVALQLVGQTGVDAEQASQPSSTLAARIDASDVHACLILGDGSVWCWGDNAFGQLGNGTKTSSAVPTPVTLPAGRTAVAITAGSFHSCAIFDDGTAACWGANHVGQLGNGTNVESTVPVLVLLASGRTAMAITADDIHTCAIFDDGVATCWGDNDHGELGNGSNDDSNVPVPVLLPAGRSATAISSSDLHTSAILDDGSVVAWGTNQAGQLGTGTSTSSVNEPIAVPLPAARSAVAIATGAIHGCALLDDDTATCWGTNQFGQVGNGSTMTSPVRPTPVLLPSGETAIAIAAGGSHACAILADGASVCWGRNSSGQLGDATNDNSNIPISVRLPANAKAVAITGGAEVTCALLDDESVYCWGDNTFKQLGDGTTNDSNVPVRVLLPTDADGDGTPDQTDLDDDEDGVSDEEENAAGSDPLDPASTPEICDGVDNDGNDGIDEGFIKTAFFRDQDGDGYGTLLDGGLACTAPPGYVADSSDCQDQDAAINPGAAEVCNGVDDDCDGSVDENDICGAPDTDGDGIPDDKDVEGIEEAVAAQLDSSFKSRGHRNSIRNALEEAEASIAAGDIAGAIGKLQNLRRKVDGCGALLGLEIADNDDWITDCAAQHEIRDLIDGLIARLRA